MKELVIHPSHYNHSGRKECWEEMREIFGDNAVAIFDILSAYKYLYRAGTKDGNPTEQDMRKIENYKNHCRTLLAGTDCGLVNAETVFCQYKKVEGALHGNK